MPKVDAIEGAEGDHAGTGVRREGLEAPDDLHVGSAPAGSVVRPAPPPRPRACARRPRVRERGPVGHTGRRHLCRLTVFEPLGGSGVEPHCRPTRQRCGGRLHACPERRRRRGGQRVPRCGVVERERPHPRPDEALHRRAATQRGAEVAGQSADVRTLAAHDGQPYGLAGDLLDVEGVNDDLARLARHLDALPGQLVQSLPLVVNRRVHRRHLLDAPDEGTAGDLQLRAVHGCHRRGREHPSAQVSGVGGEPEPERRHVRLVLVGQVRHELGRLAEQDGQHARGVGVERPGVTHALETESAPHEHHVE